MFEYYFDSTKNIQLCSNIILVGQQRLVMFECAFGRTDKCVVIFENDCGKEKRLVMFNVLLVEQKRLVMFEYGFCEKKTSSNVQI